MWIGVYFTPSKTQGGVYTYAVAILESLAKIKGNRYVIINVSPDVPAKFRLDKNFTIIDFHSRSREIALKTRDSFSYLLAKLAPWLTQVLYRFQLYHLLTPIYRLTMLSQIKMLEEQNLDLIFYPTSSNLSFLARTPAVVTVHDLQHRLNPQFPEVSAGGRWEHREYGFININQKAFRILVDSKKGKQDMLRFYPVQPKRIVVLPYLAPSYLNPSISSMALSKIKKQLKLPDKFVFYPAKFWPHKMHVNLIRAIKLVNQKTSLNLVLTGSKEADFSSFDAVFRLVEELDLKDRVHFLGYVNDQQFSAIYKLAEALVMPTYFGPTNIPVLEAWVMGTPVIYSDIPGCRQQLGPAGLLINPDKPQDIARQILKLLNSAKLKCRLTKLGRERVKQWTPKQFKDTIAQIINDFRKGEHVHPSYQDR